MAGVDPNLVRGLWVATLRMMAREGTSCTDGSAFNPRHQQAKVCSWAVTEATPQSNINQIRAGGLLAARRQTVFRLELHAVNSAIVLSRKATISSDNEAAVRRVRQINMPEMMLAQHPDRELLRTTKRLLQGRDVEDIQVIWISTWQLDVMTFGASFTTESGCGG